MKTILITEILWTIVAAIEVMNSDIYKGAKMEFIYRSNSAVYTITVAVKDHCLGSTTDTDDPVVLRKELRDRQHASAQATIHVSLSD